MQVSRYWFRDPSSHVAGGPFRRTATLCLEVFPSTPSRRTLKVPGRSIHGVAPPSEYDRRGRPRFVHGMPRGASHEVSGSSSTCQLSSPLNPGLPHPVRSVPRVFHPLDGFRLDSLPGLVSCRERSWSSMPFRAFPSSGAVVPLDTLCLLAIHRDDRTPADMTLGTADPCEDRSVSGALMVWLQGFAPRSESVAVSAFR